MGRVLFDRSPSPVYNLAMVPLSARRVAVYPGSFDPLTNGHLDIVERACRLFDHLIVAVSRNFQKNTLFTLSERRRMLSQALAPLVRTGRVSVDVFEGLLVDYVEARGAVAVVRGLRAVSDFEYEFQMALMNRRQAPAFETVFLTPDEKYTYLSSTLLKDILRLGGPVERFVPAVLVPALKQRMGRVRRRP